MPIQTGSIHNKSILDEGLILMTKAMIPIIIIIVTTLSKISLLDKAILFTMIIKQ